MCEGQVARVEPGTALPPCQRPIRSVLGHALALCDGELCFVYEQTSFITQTNALQRVATIHVHATQTMFETHVHATQTMFETHVHATQTMFETHVHATQTMFETHTQALQAQEHGHLVQHWL